MSKKKFNGAQITWNSFFKNLFTTFFYSARFQKVIFAKQRKFSILTYQSEISSKKSGKQEEK